MDQIEYEFENTANKFSPSKDSPSNNNYEKSPLAKMNRLPQRKRNSGNKQQSQLISPLKDYNDQHGQQPQYIEKPIQTQTQYYSPTKQFQQSRIVVQAPMIQSRIYQPPQVYLSPSRPTIHSRVQSQYLPAQSYFLPASSSQIIQNRSPFVTRANQPQNFQNYVQTVAKQQDSWKKEELGILDKLMNKIDDIVKREPKTEPKVQQVQASRIVQRCVSPVRQTVSQQQVSPMNRSISQYIPMQQQVVVQNPQIAVQNPQVVPSNILRQTRGVNGYNCVSPQRIVSPQGIVMQPRQPQIVYQYAQTGKRGVLDDLKHNFQNFLDSII